MLVENEENKLSDKSKKESIKQGHKTAKRKGPHGQIFLSWSFPEYGTAFKKSSWQMAAIVLGVILLMYSVFSANYLFAVVIVLFAVIFYFQTIQKPMNVNCQITEDGVRVGKKFYDYRDLNKFWLIYEPPHF